MSYGLGDAFKVIAKVNAITISFSSPLCCRPSVTIELCRSNERALSRGGDGCDFNNEAEEAETALLSTQRVSYSRGPCTYDVRTEGGRGG